MQSARAMTLILLTPLLAIADDKPKPQASPAERLAAIKKEHADDEAELRKTMMAMMAMPETPENDKKADSLGTAFDGRQKERFATVIEIAKDNPKSDVGLAALEWLLTNPRVLYMPIGKAAMQMTIEQYVANPKVGKIVAWVGYFPPRQHENEAVANALIDAVAEKNPDRTARGQALMAKAWEAESKFEIAEYKATPEVQKLAAEAEKAFELVIKEYGDCPRLMRENSSSLGEAAKQYLFDLRHLRVGKVAPDIDGEDLDGVKFKLSDYRGKVVVLDFWGDW
jgi:hypothetical protein